MLLSPRAKWTFTTAEPRPSPPEVWNRLNKQGVPHHCVCRTLIRNCQMENKLLIIQGTHEASPPFRRWSQWVCPLCNVVRRSHRVQGACAERSSPALHGCHTQRFLFAKVDFGLDKFPNTQGCGWGSHHFPGSRSLCGEKSNSVSPHRDVDDEDNLRLLQARVSAFP
jgi:hypothetical protein